ncbi:MAG: NUDIX hydrolase [Acidobacteria bacterium]|nr:NUDIX hydrolase [Acidobacteriota bacterium]
MFVKPDEIARMELLYGRPAEDRVAFEMAKKDWGILKGSQVGGRSHDVTVYVRRGEEVAVIAKHPYPPGIFRAPSGGVLPSESMEEGIAREMMEELGLEILLRRYLLRETADFSHGDMVVRWTTHVFTADPLTMDLAPRDHKEIREARWISMEELTGRIGEALAASHSAGLRYRAYLHRQVVEELSRPG